MTAVQDPAVESSASRITSAASATRSSSAPVTRMLVGVIGFYRVAISPIRPPACRYVPSCSEYAVDALRGWGPARGSWLALRRLLRCHPWHAGGFDPVPARPALSTAPSLPAAVEE